MGKKSDKQQDKHCLIFYHIEKTAGTTFNDILARQYGRKNRYHLHPPERRKEIAAFKDMSEEERAQYTCLTGHMSHLLADHVPLPVKYVTFLREPMKQVMSSYNYTKYNAGTKAHDRIKDLKSVDEYLDWQLGDRRDNIQTRYLANVTRFMEEHTGQVDFAKDGEELYKKALEKLKSMEHVYITEKFDEALVMMKKDLNWAKRLYYHQKNTSQHFEKPTKAQEDRIRKVHHYDFELYKHAQEIHEQAAKKYKNLERDVQHFRNMNKLAGKIAGRFAAEDWLRTIVHHGRERGFLPG